MNSFRHSLAVILTLLFLFSAVHSFAHGGDHKAKKEEIVTPVDSMYSNTESEKDLLSSSGDSLDDMFSPTDLFAQDELVSPDPMPMNDEKMEGGHDAHAEHQQIILSHHERVSFSSKGFGTAVGITLLAGMVFAGLTFMRPGE
ncbi:MAG: hypothetical protein HOF21_14495 [Nitrospina sp.]|nr:hypothetical protein [Nitrospina sp.]MBT5632879.1 hypothetical protein [Nitrospina sp.]